MKKYNVIVQALMNLGIMLNNYSLPLFFCLSVQKKKKKRQFFISFF